MTLTSRTSRVLIFVLGAALAATSLGCGFIQQAKDIVGTAQVLSDFADRLGKSAELTYTAEYAMPKGEKVTLAQKPPNSAFVATDGSIIVTQEFFYFCGTEKGESVCQKSPNTAGSVSSAESGLVAGLTGPGFITPEMALGLIAAAAFVPGAKVEQSEKTIADQKSLCATATGLEAAASPGDTDAPKDFTVCITELGVLASFSGTSTTGEAAAIELTSFSPDVDEAKLAPPKGATITDVSQIEVPQS